MFVKVTNSGSKSTSNQKGLGTGPERRCACQESAKKDERPRASQAGGVGQGSLGQGPGSRQEIVEGLAGCAILAA